MLPTTDLLPLDFSTSPGQAIDSKANLLPSSDLEATFSDFMREPLSTDQGPVAAFVGEDLPQGGSQLPVDQLLENGGDPSEALFNAEFDFNSASSGQYGTQTEIDAAVFSIEPASQTFTDNDAHLALAVANSVDVEDQSISVGPRHHRTEMDPFMQQSLVRQTLNSENGADRLRALTTEPTLFERQQPLRELPETSHVRNQHSVPDLNAYQGDKLIPEVASNLAVNSKVEGAEQVLKPNIPFNSIAVSGAPIDTTQVRLSPTGTVSAMPSITTTIDVPVTDKAWGSALQDRVMWMTGRGIQNAEIRLNPAELGPIRVQVSVENDAAQLAFSAQNALTRDAIEQMMPRLREMLSESGLSLGGSTVSDGESPDVDRDQDATGSVASDTGELSSEEGVDVSASPVRAPNPTSLVDTFA